MKMNRKLLIILIASTIVACNGLIAPAVKTTPEATQPIPTSVPEETAAPSNGLSDMTIVRLHPEDGDLQSMLAAEAQKALGLGQMPVVEFDATWCPPCQAIEKALSEKNELMLSAYDGTYIIKLDVDEWEWDDGRVQNFAFTGIPVYFKLDKNGEQTGEIIDGNAWGDNIPENMAPPMDKFFHGE